MAYRGIKLLFRFLIIVFLSAIFPIILIKIFKFDMVLNLDTILYFVYLGLTAYIVYLILSTIEIIGKIIKFFIPKKNKEQ